MENNCNQNTPRTRGKEYKWIMHMYATIVSIGHYHSTLSIHCLLLGMRRGDYLLSVGIVSSDQQVWWTIQLSLILVDSLTLEFNIFNARYILNRIECPVALTSFSICYLIFLQRKSG